MINLKDILFALSKADGVGNIREATDLAESLLSNFCKTETTDNLTVIGYL